MINGIVRGGKRFPSGEGMPQPPRRAVITGLGVVSALGLDLPSLRDALRAGRNGIRPIRHFSASTVPVKLAAEIDGFDARQFLDKKDRKSLKMMVRTIQLGVAASRLALGDASLDTAALNPERFGVEFGTSTIPGELLDLAEAARASLDETGEAIDMARWGRDGVSRIPPMWLLNHVPNMPACHVSIINNAQGPNNTITGSDAASLLALGEAVRILQRDAADVFLAGGSDTRTSPINFVRHTLFSQLSRQGDPARACRPFDRNRDGAVPGEGAGVLVVEDLEHARRRGARIRAAVAGFASAFDRGGSGAGLARAVTAALAQAGIGPADLDHVNANAPGTVEDDAREARGLAQALAGAAVPVLAAKSFLGH